MLCVDVLLSLLGSCAADDGAPGCSPTLAVPDTVEPPAAVILPGTFPTDSVAPEAMGPAILQVRVPLLTEHSAGSPPDWVNPVGSGKVTRSEVASSGPALVTLSA